MSPTLVSLCAITPLMSKSNFLMLNVIYINQSKITRYFIYR